MNVPFVDLRGQYLRIREEIDATLAAILEDSAFIGGPRLAAFERRLAGFMGTRYAKGVASGTASLTMTLRAIGLERGEEVIVPVHTAMPTAEAVALADGVVVFADIDEDTYLLDPERVKECITPRTKALIAVHLYGLCAPMDALCALAERYDLILIEDVAQAQGARFRGRRAGTFGHAGCLSFFPSKNLGGFGDGGAVVTDDAVVDTFVSMYSNHGRSEKFTHEMIGANERLDTLQAAVLEAKLRHLDDWNARRRQVASWYSEALGDVDEIALPRPLPDTEPVWHLYVVRVCDRDGLRAYLKQRGIETGLHYPLSLHRQPAWESLGYQEGDFPAAERVTSSILSLPMDPFLTREQVQHVAECTKEFLASRQHA
jgi:dTDP-4-amino-4,6-dideoxygalactose transaminase